MPVTKSPFASDVGIAGISWQGWETALPAGTTVLPSGDVAGAATLEALFNSRLEEGMKAFLRPDINTRELLLPGFFNSRLHKAQKKLREAARRGQSPASARAADLLEEDDELKELLFMYRGLLQKG